MTFTTDRRENLTPAEFLELYTNFTIQAQRDLASIKELANSDEPVGSITYLPKIEKLDYWNKSEIVSDSFYNCDPEDVQEVIDSFNKECENIKNKKGFYVSQRVDSYDGYVEDIFFFAEYYVPKDEISENEINRAFREYLKFWLVPEDYTDYIQTPDCKIITLFKEGKIDWKTVRVLTYSDCDL